MRQALRRLPILLGMLLLVLPWAVWAGNVVTGWVSPGARLWQSPKLSGTQAAPAPGLGPRTLWNGRYQRDAAAAFRFGLPLFPEAVALKNQVYFSLLGQSPWPLVVRGRRDQLYEWWYIYEYCHREPAKLQEQAEDWAAKLAAMQAWYAARGRVFLYVVTPSKAATYPQYFARGTDCPAPQADRDRMLPLWHAALQRHGVQYVDAATLTQQAKPHYSIELFPRGGTHWNEIASTLAAQTVVERINALPSPWKLTPFTFTWHVVPPEGVDRDITDLLNLVYPKLDYPAAEVTIAATPPAVCRPVNIGAVGGSFFYEIAWALMKLPCPPVIEFYSYFSLDHAYFPGDLRQPTVPEQRNAELLGKADIVILEENEQVAMRSHHGPAFYGLVTGQPDLDYP